MLGQVTALLQVKLFLLNDVPADTAEECTDFVQDLVLLERQHPDKPFGNHKMHPQEDETAELGSKQFNECVCDIVPFCCHGLEVSSHCGRANYVKGKFADPQVSARYCCSVHKCCVGLPCPFAQLDNPESIVSIGVLSNVLLQLLQQDICLLPHQVIQLAYPANIKRGSQDLLLMLVLGSLAHDETPPNCSSKERTHAPRLLEVVGVGVQDVAEGVWSCDQDW